MNDLVVGGQSSMTIGALDLGALEALKAKGNTGVKESVTMPKMVLFHNTPYGDCTYPNGSWIVGQEKEKDGANKGKIIEQGKLVEAFTVLAVRMQYNYFNEKDMSNNCDSNYFIDFNDVKTGYKHGHACGKTCPYRQLAKDGCKAQIVIIGIARCADGTRTVARFYAKGSAYMPTKDFLDSGYKIQTATEPVTLECYMAEMALASDGPHVNGSTSFFIPVLQLCGVHPQEEWDGLFKEHQNAVKYFELSDKAKSDKIADATQPAQNAAGAAQTVVPQQTVVQQQPAQQTVVQEINNPAVVQQGAATQPEIADIQNDLDNILNQ